MKAETFFRLLIIINVLLPVIGMGHTELFYESYSKDWQDLISWHGDRGILDSEFSNSSPTIFTAILIVLVLVLIVNIIGLMLFKKWARKLFVILTAFGYLITPFFGINVHLPVEFTLYGISELALGAILAMSFLSPIRQRFEH